MSYHTYYSISIEQGDSNLLGDIMEELFKVSEDAKSLLDNDGSEKFDGSWDNADEEILEVSKIFPDVTILLTTEGEARGDFSNTYFKNGKSQYCPAKITIEDFDESKLV